MSSHFDTDMTGKVFLLQMVTRVAKTKDSGREFVPMTVCQAPEAGRYRGTEPLTEHCNQRERMMLGTGMDMGVPGGIHRNPN